MTWRRVGAIYVVVVVLGLVVAWSAREHSDEKPASKADAPSLLNVPADAVARIAFVRDGQRVEAVRGKGHGWAVQGPANVEITADLIAAAVATLTAGQTSEIMGEVEASDLEAFGLERPGTLIEITLRDRGSAPLRVLVGGPNPTGTAVYAMRDGARAVHLVGLNLRYYADLIFQAVGPSVTPGPAATCTRSKVAT